MKTKRKIVEFDETLCNGCGECVPACAEGAIRIVDGKARLVSENYCDGLGACLKECPQGAIRIIEREARSFDQQAVENYLKERESAEKTNEIHLPCGCPSSHIQTFEPAIKKASDVSRIKTASALSHWPVQIRLVPANAHFLKGGDLLVAADCTPVAYADFHGFLKGRAVLLGCQKFDDVKEYLGKFSDIFRESDIQSVTVLVMEVPCCSALPAIVREGMEIAKKKVPMEKIVISTRGEILQRLGQ